MKLELVTRKYVSHVELVKDEKHWLGMAIVDATKDEAGPVVKKIKSKSPAERSFAVGEGDVILSFNGISMVGNKSKDIIRMIKEAGNSVEFKLQYEIKEIRVSHPVVYCKRQRKIVLYKVEGSFGFILRKDDSVNLLEDDYPVISNIKEGSHVHRLGLLQEGDRLLKADGVNLSCLSLREISHFLQVKTKVEFVYQYDVGKIGYAESERKVDLDIDIPNSDLGIYLTTDKENSGLMYIEKIRMGSIAERCGIFREGDVIFSIDDIDTKLLTVSKACTLLRNCKKCRKISFIPCKRKKTSLPLQIWSDQSDSSKPDKSKARPDDTQKYSVDASEISSIDFPSKQEIFLQKSYLIDQMKSISYLQNMVRVIRSMKQIQTEMKVEKKLLNASGYCAFCGESEHSEKHCFQFLAKVNVACAQSIDVLQSIVSQFICHSSRDFQKNKLEANMVEKESGNNILSKANKVELVHVLTETLPDVFSGDYHLKEQLLAIAEKVNHADTSCTVCDIEVQSIWITVQKLMLLLSLDYSRRDIRILINRLLRYLLKTDFSCNTLSICKSELYRNIQFEKPLYMSSVHFTPDVRLPDNNGYFNQTDMDSESVRVWAPVEKNIAGPRLDMHREYLKITHIQSLSASEESGNENDLCEADMDAKTLLESDCFSLQENNLENLSTFPKFEDAVSNKNERFNKDKVLNNAPAKLWRSLDSILKSTSVAKDQPSAPQKFSQNTSKCKATKTGGMTQSVPGTSADHVSNRLSANHKPSASGTHTSNFDEGSTPSTFTNSTQKNKQCKIRVDTIDVKMINSGEGFGLGLGFKFLSSKSSAVPVIQSIKPRSPSQRSGVLKPDDRIVAINHRSTSGLAPKELQILKKAFLADTITLTVEFDVADEALKVGIFDVVLDKTLKIGLVFEDMQRGYPMVVSGIVKGSGAHRCGQLFPGDKITFFRCMRNEEFDPVSCNYSKEESVLITVQRDRVKTSREKSANPSPCYMNPCFNHKDSVPRRGLAFVVKSSAIHVVDGTDSLVLDQEVTLFRDPVSWDFGFLVGENPDTGRAYVTDVRPDGPASKSGVMKKLDRILEVNGVSVDKNLEHSVLSLLSQANHKVDLLIRRLYHDDSNSV